MRGRAAVTKTSKSSHPSGICCATIISLIHDAVPFGTAWQQQYVDPRSAGYNFYGPVTASNPGPLPGSNSMDAVVMRPGGRPQRTGQCNRSAAARNNNRQHVSQGAMPGSDGNVSVCQALSESSDVEDEPTSQGQYPSTHRRWHSSMTGELCS